MIFKEKLISTKKFYRNNKNNVFLAPFLRTGKFVYRLLCLGDKIHRWEMFSRATFILRQIDKDTTVGSYIKELKNKNLLRKNFSLGHADDFDIVMLYLLTRIKKPDTIVETGVASGRSSSAILEALCENKKGLLFSVDLPKFYEGQSEIYLTEEGRPEHSGFVPKGKEPGWLVSRELRARWKLILGDSKIELPKLAGSLEKVDIFYHDSNHSYDSMMHEFKTMWPLIPNGGILLSDDVRGNSAFDDFVVKIKPKFNHVYDGLGIILK